MKLTKCDRHHDRDAVATFKIREMSVGSRPLLLGLEGDVRVIDLCDECAKLVRPLLPAKTSHSS